MRRRLFNLAAAVSLALYMASVTTWTIAQWRPISVGSMDEDSVLRSEYLNKRYYVRLGPRLAVIRWYENNSHRLLSTRYDTPGPGDFVFIRAPEVSAPNGKPWARHGVLAFPYWSVLLITAALPVSWGVIYRKQRRRALRLAAGLCPVCGYDMRASPDRCSECGTAVPPRAQVEMVRP